MRKALLVICFLLLAAPAWGATYYVDCNTGTGGDGSLGTPWDAVDDVNNETFSAGDFILFNRGCTFDETLTVPSSGSLGSPITFGAYGSGNLPVLNGGDARNYGIDINSKNYITIQDMRIIDTVLDGIYQAAQASALITGIVIDGVEIDGPDDDCIDISGAATMAIMNSSFANTTTGDGMYISSATDNTSSTNVTINNNSFTGSFGRWPITIVSCETCYVTYNTLAADATGTNEPNGGEIDVEPNAGLTTSGVEVAYNNINAVTPHDHVISITGVAGSTSSNNSVHHNYINLNGLLSNDGIRIGGTSTGTSAYNNTIVNCGGTSAAGRGFDFTMTSGTASAYNNYIESDDALTTPNCYTFNIGSGANDVDVYYNVMFKPLVPFSVGGTSTAEIYNNTTIQFLYKGLDINTGTTTTLKNNLFYTTDIGNNTIYDDSSGGATLTSDYNLWKTADASSIFCTGDGTTCYNTLALWSSNVGQDNNSTASTPTFINLSGKNYRPLLGSPAIDAGVDVSLTSDYEGKKISGTPDIGAYEFGVPPSVFASKDGVGVCFGGTGTRYDRMRAFYSGNGFTGTLLDMENQYTTSLGCTAGTYMDKWNCALGTTPLTIRDRSRELCGN